MVTSSVVLGPNTALIVTTAASALVLTLIVVLLLILLRLRILRYVYVANASKSCNVIVAKSFAIIYWLLIEPFGAPCINLVSV